jgi:hypothetical protein
MGLLDKGPGYTVADLVYYAGLFGGIILVYLALQPLGVHPLVRLVAGLAVGIGLGYLFETAYRRSKSKKDPNEHDEYQR